MKKILVIGGGAMGSAFTIPCLENNNRVTITEPYSRIFIRNLSSKNKFHSALKIKLPKKLKQSQFLFATKTENRYKTETGGQIFYPKDKSFLEWQNHT